jgi:uridine phosphorylase
MQPSYPILEYDPNPDAIINPYASPLSVSTPDRAVLCFFKDVLDELLAEGKLMDVGGTGSEMGRHPFYDLPYQGQHILVAHPGVGAPLAGAILDELIALGIRKYIACGGCGVLDEDIVCGHAVVLKTAVRDEGTSYHYLPPSREVSAGVHATQVLEETLTQGGVPYILAKSWTTDSYYRETNERRARRVEEGCLVVEMEASAFFSIAQFRGVEFGQLLYSGDIVVPEGWDMRAWNDRKDLRQNLFWLAVEACRRL